MKQFIQNQYERGELFSEFSYKCSHITLLPQTP